jgi:hypothetical protein
MGLALLVTICDKGFMDKPSPKALVEATGISSSYASMILSGDRTPTRSLAIFIFRSLGWPHPSIADLTEEQMQVFEEVEPWVPAKAKAA